MEQHPIEGIMRATLDSIKDMVDVNTILGDPVETPDGSVIMPVSRVTFGFAAGGSEFTVNKPENNNKKDDEGKNETELPFGGGSGAGITIQPVAFLIVNKDQTRLLPVDSNVVLDHLLDLAPPLMERFFGKKRTLEPHEAPAGDLQ
ncbi:MAG: GerW family sporulation protein [Bacillota bacterium]